MNQEIVSNQIRPNYDFPVSLQKTFTAEGREVPRSRAVVRGDTNEPIAVVSTSYRLIPHKDIMEQADKYVKTIGEPKANFYITGNGAKVVGEFTFMDKTLAVRKNELVGLRMYIDNNYNATGSMKVRIGGLCMWCMNGAVSHRDVFQLNVPHIGNHEITFPHPDQVFESFQNTIQSFKQLAEIPLSRERQIELTNTAAHHKIVPTKAFTGLNSGEDKIEESAWGLYNHFTYYITHKENSRSTAHGRITRLNNVGRWFDDVFIQKEPLLHGNRI